MMIARRSAIFSFAKPPTSGSRKLKNVYPMSGSIALNSATPCCVHTGFILFAASNTSCRNVAGSDSQSSSFWLNASQRDWSSSMIEISTRPICGIVFPFIAATAALSHGSSPGWKSQTTLRYSGFASSTIFAARRHSFSA